MPATRSRPPGRQDQYNIRYVTAARRICRKPSRLLELTNMGLSNAERQRRLSGTPQGWTGAVPCALPPAEG